jgi:hypothetical protein
MAIFLFEFQDFRELKKKKAGEIIVFVVRNKKRTA